MATEISGKIIQKLEEQTGTSKAGKSWTKQDFIVETSEQYPKKICVTAFGEKMEMLRNVAVGSDVKVAINIESRDFNGKWYTNIGAWKIDVLSAAAVAANSAANNEVRDNEPPVAMDIPANGAKDDLPF